MKRAVLLPSAFVPGLPKASERRTSSFNLLISTKVRGLLLLILILFTANISSAQIKHTESIQQVWFGYFNQTRFSDKWGMWADLHLRTKEDFFSNFSQAFIRLGLTYHK